MRRSEREIKDLQEIKSIIEECKVMRIALKDDEGLYIVPVNFGYAYKNNKFEFYFHSSKKGRKIEALRLNPDVAFEMDCEHELVVADIACNYSYHFASVMGCGSVTFLEGQEKLDSLSALMKHQTNQDFEFDERVAKSVEVCKITASELSVKANR